MDPGPARAVRGRALRSKIREPSCQLLLLIGASVPSDVSSTDQAHWMPSQDVVTFYDLDMDDSVSDPAIVASLRASNPGVMIICYINVGAWEPWREVIP